MKVIEKPNKYYSRYYGTENRQFAIGVEKMLFGRLRLQVLHAHNEEPPQ